MQSSVAVPGGRSVVIRWALHEESYWQKSLKDSYLRSRKEGESLSVRLQRWDGMRQQLDRSLCQLRGHERSERKRERSADGGVLLKVCDGRESGSGRGRKRSRQVKRAVTVTVPLLVAECSWRQWRDRSRESRLNSNDLSWPERFSTRFSVAKAQCRRPR